MQDREGVPVDQQMLILGGQHLQDEQTLMQYSIGADSVLHLRVRCRYIIKNKGVHCWWSKAGTMMSAA